MSIRSRSHNHRPTKHVLASLPLISNTKTTEQCNTNAKTNANENTNTNTSANTSTPADITHSVEQAMELNAVIFSTKSADPLPQCPPPWATMPLWPTMAYNTIASPNTSTNTNTSTHTNIKHKTHCTVKSSEQ